MVGYEAWGVMAGTWRHGLLMLVSLCTGTEQEGSVGEPGTSLSPGDTVFS